MVLVKILKRRDSSSLIVAIVLALIVAQSLPLITGELAGVISGAEKGHYFGGLGSEAGWQAGYLYHVVWALLQIVLLEILAWIVIGLRAAFRLVKKK